MRNWIVSLMWLVVIRAPMVLAEGARLNVLHIHADDLRADGLHALGIQALQTPNLDALVENGLVFRHCYTQGSMIGAVCRPSRTMLLTGRSWQRIPGAPAAAPDANDSATFLPSLLGAAGYETWHMGKGGNEFPPALEKFATNIVDKGKGDAEPSGWEYTSRRHADRTIEFLRNRDPSRPFYVYLAPSVPHDPRLAEPEFHARYEAARLPLLPAFMPLHPWDNGDMQVRDEGLAPWPRTPENTREHLADYYATVTCLDHHVGRIFAALRETGQWDRTLIVFSSDNGLSLGEHGLFGKQNLYEFGGMHVPCVIAGPGVRRGTSKALVYLMDLFPTFCEVADAKVPAGVEGKSLLPIARGEISSVRDVLYTGYQHAQRSIRDDRWKLIRYPLVDKTQLFDLRSDPRELDNLAEKPEHAAQVARLMSLLEKEMRAYGDPTPLRVPNPRPAAWTPPDPAKQKAKRAA